MKYSDKIVTTIPLETIWTDENEIHAFRNVNLTRNDIKQLIGQSTVQFVVADIGHKLKWVDSTHGFDFWKSEVEKHLADNINKIELDSFVDNYAYVASQWTEKNMTPIILLEKIH